MHVYEIIWQNSSNVFRINAFFFCYLWNRRTYNLAKATGFHSFFSSLLTLLFFYLSTSCSYWCTPLFISFSSSSENAVVNSCNLIWAVSVQMAVSLHPSPFLSSFDSDGYFLFCTVAPLSLSFSLSLCLKIKTTFRGDREIDHVDKRSAWLQPWRCGSSFSLSLYSPRDKLLISVSSMITSCIQSEQLP